MSAFFKTRGNSPYSLIEVLEDRRMFSVAIDYPGSVGGVQSGQHAAPSAARATPAAKRAPVKNLTFWPPETLSVYTSAYPGSASMAIADLNGDNRSDIIVNTADGYTNVLYNLGGGNFHQFSIIDNGTDPTHKHTQYTNSSVLVGSWTGGSSLDLAVSSYDPFQNTANYAILPGNGDTTFGLPISQSAPVGPMQLIGGGDVNNDRSVDLLGTFGGHGGVLLNNGDGTFTPGTTFNSNNFAVADLNGDSVPDLIEGSGGSLNNNGPIVQLGRADGTFSNPLDLPLQGTNGTWSFTTGDFNNDGNADIIASATTTSGGKAVSRLYYMAGNFNGTFSAAKLLATANGQAALPPISALVAADLNVDGYEDISYMTPVYRGSNISGFTLHTLKGNGTGHFSAGPTRSLQGNNLSVPKMRAADIDGDGKPDLIITGLMANKATIYYTFNG